METMEIEKAENVTPEMARYYNQGPVGDPLPEIDEERFSALYKMELMKLQNYCREQDQIEMPLLHDFSPGLYIRQIFMPKGSFVIGKTHKTEHFNIVLTGSANVIIDGKMKHVSAPDIFISKAGVKKALYILEDMVWATTHVTEETDLDALEKELIYSFEEEKLMIENEVKEIL